MFAISELPHISYVPSSIGLVNVIFHYLLSPNRFLKKPKTTSTIPIIEPNS